MISNDEKMLKERIRHLLAAKNVKISDLAESESDRVMLGRQINGENTTVPFRTLYRILYQFHDVDANWLILGEGKMQRSGNLAAPHIQNFKNEVNGNKAGGDIYVGTDTIPYPVRALLNEKDKRITELEADKELLKNILTSLTTKK